MSAHTPGPWRLYIARDMGDHLVSAPNGSASVIATLVNYDRAPEHADRKRDEANARLIAAAPRMLEFIQRIASYTTIPWTAEQAKDILRDVEGQP